MIERIKDLWLSLLGILLFFLRFKHSSFWSRDRMKKYQYKKLKKLLLVCERDVPYYKELFSSINFVVERDFAHIEDVKKIPITEKKLVRETPDKFINKKYVKSALHFSTSGSTGKPLSVLVSRNHWVVEQAVVWRHWFWGGYRFRDKMAIVRSYAPKDGRLIKMDKLRNFRYYSPFHLSDDNIKFYLKDMVEQKIRVIRGYPSSVRALADYVIKTGCEIPKLKLILTASEVLSDGDRDVIEKAFHTKVSNHYGLAETIVMMGDCERHNGLHNYDEYGYLELLDTDNDRFKQVIGTNLNNYAMPLLRYQTGDLADYDKHLCGCKRSSVVVNNIVGRGNAIMKLEDRIIPLTNFYTVLEHYTPMKSWQIIQKSLNEIELRFAAGFDAKIDEEVKKEFAFRLPKDITLSIVYDATFIRKNEGKKPPFISLIQ